MKTKCKSKCRYQLQNVPKSRQQLDNIKPLKISEIPTEYFGDSIDENKKIEQQVYDHIYRKNNGIKSVDISEYTELEQLRSEPTVQEDEEPEPEIEQEPTPTPTPLPVPLVPEIIDNGYIPRNRDTTSIITRTNNDIDIDTIFSDIDSTLINNEAGQISPRMFFQETLSLTDDKRVEHPKFEIPSERTFEFTQQSLCKVFTTPIDTHHQCANTTHNDIEDNMIRRLDFARHEPIGRYDNGQVQLQYEQHHVRDAIPPPTWFTTTATASTSGTRWTAVTATATTTSSTVGNHDHTFTFEPPHPDTTCNTLWYYGDTAINTHESLGFGLTGHNHGDRRQRWYSVVPNPNDNIAESKRFKHRLESWEINQFKKDPPRYECCFRPVFAPYGWYNDKVRLGEALDSCEEMPEKRIFSRNMGLSLDYCKKHFKIALDWHREEFGAMPPCIRSFTKKEKEKLVEDRRLNTLRRLQELRERQEILENREKATKNANELLKKWLSPAEYNYLMENEELELPSQYEKDVIYIVKKDYSSKVIKKKKVPKTYYEYPDKPVYEEVEHLCVMPVNSGYVNDDYLLSKILLLKTNEKEFLELANHYPV